MALVHVEDVGVGQAVGVGVGAHGPDTADTGEDLLLDAVVLVAAVETVGDAAHLGVVLRDVGVEQQQRHAAHLRDPHPGAQHPAAGHRDVDEDRRRRRPAR